MVNMCIEVKACPFDHLSSRDYTIQVEMHDAGVIYCLLPPTAESQTSLFREKISAVVLTLKFWLYMGF